MRSSCIPLGLVLCVLCTAFVPAYAEDSPSAEAKCAPCPKKPSDDGALALRAHEKNFFIYTGLMGSNNEDLNGLPPADTQNNEAHFQISVESAFINGSVKGNPLRVYFAYTQRSFWQIFSDSAPFRENNYEPELFVAYEGDIDGPGFKFTRIGAGAAHQSNGRAQEFSRSWNRVYAMVKGENDTLGFDLEAWYRVPESNDDNPDLIDYLGYGELNVVYKYKRSNFGMMLRANPATSKGAVQLDYVYNLSDSLGVYVLAFDGYGESLIDYNNHVSRIGVGFTIVTE